ncbi:single-strand selective monofunctional uracil DNA glycosylase-like isoform X2 [Cimex lectularius]|uniref:Uracil-DNA glycosylase-like domain-containing protein n=1 Tax=Cimex lectularius TaxID=79782 RepID=A0A8I6RBJ1_CIMLE|nr:single-strand selective monofunctional uracil DNA glycosylase-like isoform X2 [Cimex lectularius]
MRKNLGLALKSKRLCGHGRFDSKRINFTNRIEIGNRFSQIGLRAQSGVRLQSFRVRRGRAFTLPRSGVFRQEKSPLSRDEPWTMGNDAKRGLDCKRREVSGKRFWSLVELLGDGSPHDFFRNCTVHNYFPLCLLSGKGKNVTPPELKTAVQKEINEMCDQSLVNVISLLDIEIVIAVGRFAEKRAQIIKERFQLPIRVCYISHPSPRNPESNKNWLLSTKDLLLNKYGLLKLFSP